MWLREQGWSRDIATPSQRWQHPQQTWLIDPSIHSQEPDLAAPRVKVGLGCKGGPLGATSFAARSITLQVSHITWFL